MGVGQASGSGVEAGLAETLAGEGGAAGSGESLSPPARPPKHCPSLGRHSPGPCLFPCSPLSPGRGPPAQRGGVWLPRAGAAMPPGCVTQVLWTPGRQVPGCVLVLLQRRPQAPGCQIWSLMSTERGELGSELCLFDVRFMPRPTWSCSAKTRGVSCKAGPARLSSGWLGRQPPQSIVTSLRFPSGREWFWGS